MPAKGYVLIWALDLQMDGREWREGDGGRRRAASGSGAMASVEKFGDEHGKTPTGHERTNWEHGEKDKEMANVTRALVGASKHQRRRSPSDSSSATLVSS